MTRDLRDIACELHTAALVDQRLGEELLALEQQAAGKREESRRAFERRRALQQELVAHAEAGLT